MLTTLQKQIVEYYIAIHEDEPPSRELEGYFAAFNGDFAPSRDFVLHAPTTNELVLFYNIGEGRGRYRWMKKDAFASLCRKTGATLAAIADFCLRLEEQDCLKGEYLERERRDLSATEQKNWRRYQDFNSLEITAIRNFRSLRFTPQVGLYRLWESFWTERAAGE